MMTPTPTRFLRNLARAALPLLAGAVMLTAAFAEAAAPPGSRLSLEAHKGTVIRLPRPASTVFVSDPDVCDIQMKSPRLVYLIGKKPGETTVYAVDGQENFLAKVDVEVTHNLSRLTSAMRSLHPTANIQVSSVEDAVVIEGVVDSASAAEDARAFAAQYVGKEGRVINRIGVAAPVQVNLRVRVAEIRRDIEKQLGINWSVLLENGSEAFLFSTVNPLAAAGSITDTLGLRIKEGDLDINVLLDVLEQEGLVSLLAEPNLTSLSGETASFLAGGEFPILVPQGNDQVTVEFKKFGVSLAFTPTIIERERINLHVRPEVSRLSQEGAVSVPIGIGFGDTVQIPALQTRRAETTVELGSGQSFAIAGLLSNDAAHDVKKFPGISDVPIIGRLFTSDRFLRNESELVIIVTPYVVRPARDRLAAPTEGFAPPNDLERLYPGGTWKQSRQPGPASTVTPDGQRLLGTMGFALD
jgi:pilus assembly protein CpaC